MDLLSIDSLSDTDIRALLESARRLFDERRSGITRRDDLAGKMIFNLFFENSTRTLMSFAVAAHALGANVVAMPVERSSVKKGETLDDTARTLDAMRPDLTIIRHWDNGSAERVAAIMDCPVINAGDGTNEHPTQALLDAATIEKHFGRTEGLKVAICGDIRHSRVARSNAKLLRRLGAELRFAGPPALVPPEVEAHSLDEAIAGADVVMMLRVQRERLEEDLGDAPGEYLRRYGLTSDRLAKAALNAIVMHPGPINRGVEIDDGIADDSQRSLITRQVEMGVAMRMACLLMLSDKRP